MGPCGSCVPSRSCPSSSLPGCGVAGTQFHPGIAAEVGDQTITTRHVDEVTDNYCTGFETLSKAEPAAERPAGPAALRHQPVRDRRWSSTRPPSSWPTSTTWSRARPPRAPWPRSSRSSRHCRDDQKDAFREILGARAYTNDVLTQIGEISLEDQGTTDATQDDQLAEGQKLLTQWVADHDVEINPKYAVDLDTPGQVDTDLSFAVGTTAKAGLKAEPDPAYTSSLPGHLVCLD